MAELRVALESLWRCERESEALARQLAQLPTDIEAAEARGAAARQALADERERLEEAEHRRREKEAELQDCEARRTKYQGQTSQVKTNTEYTALLSEIDGVTARISKVEEEILEAMEDVDRVGSTLKEMEGDKKREEELALRAAEELREQLAGVERDVAAHEEERLKLVTELPAAAVQPYQRTHKGRGGGTTSLQGQACVACHRDVPLETINRVIASELHTCPHCQRILVVPEE